MTTKKNKIDNYTLQHLKKISLEEIKSCLDDFIIIKQMTQKYLCNKRNTFDEIIDSIFDILSHISHAYLLTKRSEINPTYQDYFYLNYDNITIMFNVNFLKNSVSLEKDYIDIKSNNIVYENMHIPTIKRYYALNH